MRNFILIILVLFFFQERKVLTGNIQIHDESNFECLLESGVSGLFQFKRKFLKDTKFFPHKTIFNFTENFSVLIEKENTRAKEMEAKYQFLCSKKENTMILSCEPLEGEKPYYINFSLSTMRYRKFLITDYWINGNGNEVDFVHIGHGYCYSID